jgi:hypothetical protein
VRQLRGWISRLAGLPPSARRERELADEIEGHLQLHIDDNIRRGMSAEAARRDAVLKLGGVEPTKQIYRERRSIPVLENMIQDVRFAFRQLRKNPGFTAIAVVVLSMGIGKYSFASVRPKIRSAKQIYYDFQPCATMEILRRGDDAAMFRSVVRARTAPPRAS